MTINRWTARERRTLASLRMPAHIQSFLDELPYDARDGGVSPRVVMREGQAHCYSGVLFACAALRELGYAPRVMCIEAVDDDGHCIAVYERNGLWGGIGKSNYTTLRSRDAIYPYVALGLSYFDGYFNQYGKRTMRSFTEPVELEPFEGRGWRFTEGSVAYIDRAIDKAPLAWSLPRGTTKCVSRVNEQLLAAGLLGSRAEGLWRR